MSEEKRLTGFRLFLHNNKGKIWYMINMFCSIMYLVWRLFFTIPFGYGIVSIVTGFFLLIIEVLGMVEAFVHYANMYNVQGYPLPEIAPEDYPEVDCFLATYNEEEELLYKTINGLKHMDYPDKSKVHIWVCDDTRRPNIRELAKKMGVGYFDRPDNRGAKAGNLNNALRQTSAPIVVTFDADMIPKSDFLMKTVPYFADCWLRNEGVDEVEQVKLGFLQTPQSFYNPDLYQFNLFSEGRIPNEQDYFYRDIQVARTRTNSVIYGGSNTLLLRQALLDIGGFYTDAITEDFATGILIQQAGYVSLGLGEPLASGMTPTDLHNLIQQRIRWARGVISTGRKLHLYRSSKMSFAQKINYWASIWYWYSPLKRLIYIMAPIMYATFGFMVFKCTLPQVLLFWLPMYVSSNISLSMLSGNVRTTKWTGIYETALFPFMLIPVLAESFGITLKKFKVTSKESSENDRDGNLIYMMPFLILIVLSVIGIAHCVMVMFDSGSIGPIVVLFWLVYNLFALVMSLFFVQGRQAYRALERVMLSLPCRIINEETGKVIEGRTKDISLNGLAILMEKPYYIDDTNAFTVEFSDRNYHTRLAVKPVHVDSFKDRWNYSFAIIDYLGTYDDYLEIIYDRRPTLPEMIKKDSGSFEDLKVNTTKRLATPVFAKRHIVRVDLDYYADYLETGKRRGGVVKIVNFNYEFVLLDGEGFTIPEHITIGLTEHIALNVHYHSDVAGKPLYAIDDMRGIREDEELYEELLEFLILHSKEAEQRFAAMQRQRIRQAKQRKAAYFSEIDLFYNQALQEESA